MAFITFHISVIIYSNNARRRKRLTNVQVQDFSVSRDKKPLAELQVSENLLELLRNFLERL